MRDLIMTILTAGLQLVILATLGYVINFLYSKIGTEKTKRYFEIAKMIVRGVEQEFGAGNGADKKAEAVNLIKNSRKQAYRGGNRQIDRSGCI
ncbi:MAG: hypothetical protein ACFWT2_03010 [Thermoanaerobacterium thermosaccharolyticum]|jgi:LL-H family phage holin